MIKSPDSVFSNKALKINVTLRDGAEFLGCDVMNPPINESGNLVSFWHQGSLKFIPMDLVKEIDLYEDQ